MTFPLGAALAVFLAAGAAPNQAPPAATTVQQQAVPLIAPLALKSLLASQKVVLIDVREPEEFAAGHIEGAQLLPLGSLAANYAQLPKNLALVVYCRSGHRSAKAVAFLNAHGYRAVSLDGGYLAYSASVHS